MGNPSSFKKKSIHYFDEIVSISLGDGTSTPIPPSNTPQTPAGGTTSGDATPLTAARLSDNQRSDSLHQVLEQMRSLVLRENLTHNSQDLQDSIDDGSFSDNSMLSWVHQTSTDQQSYSSEEEDS